MEQGLHDSIKALRLSLILFLLAVPPLGMWGWSNPFLATGNLLPGFGFAGMILLFAFWVANGVSRRTEIRLCSVMIILMMTLLVDLFAAVPAHSAEWYGARTSFGRLMSGSDDTMGIYERHKKLRGQLFANDAKFVVLPETVAGSWSSLTESLWQSETDRFARDGRTYFVGAEVWETPTRYRNVAQIRGAHNMTFTQRYPVPVAMWRPWGDGGAVSDITGSGVVDLDGVRVGIWICFEPYLFTPCFITMWNRPDVIVVPSNSWWARETSLPTHSDQCVRSWSLLFGVPAVISKNL